MEKPTIRIEDFKKTARKIAPWIHSTSVQHFRTLSEIVNSSTKKSAHNYLKQPPIFNSAPTQVYLKMENEQITGSFKIRGALSKILSLPLKDRKKLLISCSAGNHAQGLAYAARCVNAQALVVLPVTTPLVKQRAVSSYGAKILKHGIMYDESYVYAQKLCKTEGGLFIHAYRDPLVIAGQGSIALEILEALPDVDSIIVPIGGGGLMAGIASVIKQVRPQCRIYGVVSRVAPGMEFYFRKKKYSPEKDFSGSGLADGISVKQPCLEMLKNYLFPYVDDVVSVTEKEITKAILFLLEREKTLVEGAGAVGVSVLLRDHIHWKLGKKCVVVLSGGNIDLNIVSQIIKKRN